MSPFLISLKTNTYQGLLMVSHLILKYLAESMLEQKWKKIKMEILDLIK